MFQFWPSVVKPLLQAMGARRVIEIGAGDGRNSRQLASWAQPAGVRLEIIDPEPDFDMERLRDRFPDAVRLHRRPSLEVIRDLLPADAVLIDGDHNWYTVYHELVAIYGDGGPVDAGAPIAICHDVEWPYGRRDLYYCPDRIPLEYRQAARIGGVLPHERGLSPGGYNPTLCHAEYEGGPRNGVKTAIDDFLANRGEEFRVVWLPMLFGLAVIVPRARLETSDALEAVLDSLELSRPLRSLCKMAELERVRASRPQLAPVGSGQRQGTTARSFSSALPDDVLFALLKGSLGYRYKGRAMLLNPLDMANYLALIGQLRPAAVIEIGSLEGGRTLWLADTMAALGLEVRVISVDLLPRPPSDHPGIDARVGDARNLADVLPAEEIRSLGHPLLVIEDSAHDEETCAAVLDYFDPLLAAGDYVIVEDGAFRSDGDIQPGSGTLSPPSRAIDAFLARRGPDYEIDEALCDRFGYNATFNINGWLRRR
ncbi:CmcI family methyltransferase [Nitrospirillum sp. BR 11828]|uniref:CmcI family methyltransferase n=1 Tax=Nitrospirillum sp. BR 11828 TaxID=3104325 RepID=UPI002ACADD42|nr:CmcI family methyltransferase [Nitrospirillum sp. BR 11828]MDZ5649767.1 CmcI family methyltransferase [Nitrospirillum sp. BR 11828]